MDKSHIFKIIFPRTKGKSLTQTQHITYMSKNFKLKKKRKKRNNRFFRNFLISPCLNMHCNFTCCFRGNPLASGFHLKMASWY